MLSEKRDPLADVYAAMFSVNKTGSSAIRKRFYISRRFRREFSIPYVFSTISVVIFYLKISVLAMTFFLFAYIQRTSPLPGPPSGMVCAPSRMYPLSLGRPAPDLSISFTPAINSSTDCFKARGRQGPILRCHVFVSATMWDVCCGSSCPSSNT